MCLNPSYVSRVTNFYTGEVNVRFVGKDKFDDYSDNFNLVECISVPCGKCAECCIQYSNEWAFRIAMEAKLYKQNCMITLTYAKNPVSLVRRDLQLFVKRLRKSLEPQKIRYFYCGEYGSKGSRPHYHIIVFGWIPDDLRFFFKRDNHSVYLSDKVSKLWNLGFISVEEVTLDTAKYCAKYLQKLNNLFPGLVPPFTGMSLKPGIGFSAFDEKFIETDKLYVNGKTLSIPRYFLRKYQDNPNIPQLHYNRQFKAYILEQQVNLRFNRARKLSKRFGKKILNFS